MGRTHTYFPRGADWMVIREEDYERLRNSSGGICIACEAEAFGVEPDAQGYRCNICGKDCVYGIEALLIYSMVKIGDPDVDEDEYFREGLDTGEGLDGEGLE
jgi:hypothetical protein